MAMIKTGDRVLITVNNSFSSYVISENSKTKTFDGWIIEEDNVNFPNCYLLKPFDYKTNKYVPQFRIIQKRLVLDIVKVNEDGTSNRIDLEDIDNEKVKSRHWNVTGSKGDIYRVDLKLDGSLVCNCVAGMMRRNCRHAKAVQEKINCEELGKS